MCDLNVAKGRLKELSSGYSLPSVGSLEVQIRLLLLLRVAVLYNQYDKASNSEYSDQQSSQQNTDRTGQYSEILQVQKKRKARESFSAP